MWVDVIDVGSDFLQYKIHTNDFKSAGAIQLQGTRLSQLSDTTYADGSAEGQQLDLQRP
jgi:hypothetical protein